MNFIYYLRWLFEQSIENKKCYIQTKHSKIISSKFIFLFFVNCLIIYFNNTKADYELVTSAFSLLELPNRIERFETIENLFGKVKKDGYLVLIETGNRHGSKLIGEAREFITKVKTYNLSIFFRKYL